MAGNPHSSPIDRPSPSATSRRCSLRVVARAVFNIIVVAAFTGVVVGAIWLFYNGYPWLVSVSTLLIFMIAALFVGGPWRERIAVSLCVPFFVVGGYIGFRIYFALFRFSWFEAVFSGKGGGPLGMIIFVPGFAVATAFAAAYGMDRLFRALWPVAAPPTNGEQSEKLDRGRG
jgi:hypothetical protein